MRSMTFVVAHRTSRLDARENSLEGIVTSARLGADIVEVDVRRSRDGSVVLLHDPWLGRVQRVPWPLRWSGAGLLRRLGVPTLAEALHVARGVGLQVAIDAKDEAAAPAVLDVVDAAKAFDRVLLWSGHMSTARSFASAVPEVEVGLFRDTYDDDASARLVSDAIAIGARAVSVHQDVATPAFIASARDRGVAVYCGYRPLELQHRRLPEAAAAGLRGVVTDWPAEARRQLEGA
jgi:glycerophosphoryl diester phosphodiesterase